jgi:hypothetical protein
MMRPQYRYEIIQEKRYYINNIAVNPIDSYRS